MADGSSNFWTPGDLQLGGDDLAIDLDTFYNILEECAGPIQSCPEDLSLNSVSQSESASNARNHGNSHLRGFQGAELMGPPAFYLSCNSGALDSRTGCSSGSFESERNSVMDSDYGKLKHLAHIGSPVQTCSVSIEDGISLVPGHENSGTERIGVLHFEIPSCTTTSSFAVGDVADVYSPGMGNLDVDFGDLSALSENSMETQGLPENNSCTSMEMMDTDISPHNATSNTFTVCQDSNVMCEFSDCYSTMQYSRTDDTFSADPSWYCYPPIEEAMTNIKYETEDFPDETAGPSSKMILDVQGGKIGRSVWDASMNDHSIVYGGDFKCEGRNYISPIGGNCSSNAYGRAIDDKTPSQSFTSAQSYVSSRKRSLCVKNERTGELMAPRGTSCGSVEVSEAVSRKPYYGADEDFYIGKDLMQSIPGTLPFMSSQHAVNVKDEKKNVVFASKRARHSQDFFGGLASTPNDGGEFVLNTSEQHLPNGQPSVLRTKQFGYIKDEREGKLIQPRSMGSNLSKVSPESIQSNFSEGKSHVVDDDSDVCILEDISQPAPSNRSLALGKSLVTSQHSPYGDPLHYKGVGGTRLRENDERLIFRVALQDLSQPKSEASPPDGVLAVPLLRHQRIALSWMVQKETSSSLHCLGGILADDQGLGKTISTIALILKERPPTFRTCQEEVKRELETLNLDEDDDRVSGFDVMKQNADSCQLTSNGRPVKSMNTLGQVKGRPAAGTLVVCPTSVLRQWADELHNKVTSKGNLSVLVYHGSNRTKDPCELAKYDVVLTTYSIVGMEVPKQPLVDKDDAEKGKPEAHVPPMEYSFSNRRKYHPSSSKKCLKHKKGIDSEHLESVSRPLARVGWFRVVLDEAQSIKNHRTQVARACWGLRAKRRWCLSGTPIQNAVDDLYSYFRFLRYDPYAVYTSFCSTIKAPINKNPSKGYKKLQAVLKTIMLRRTKGSLLDGEPIITLPPKSVELKKVDFSKEERDFYSRLEADSRAQFQEYAAAGTVKQNYVNILLMLLRLRQACDHPLLVKGYDSNSLWRSSVETVKKLPREKQLCLLNCLEASLAICGICNDPPEDAVVSICGHVFCNQCICEHLAGDDNQCPTTNCKVRLNLSSVFSEATLNSSISDQPGQDSSSDCSGSELVESVEPCYEDFSYESSKIKAAIEVLKSLSNPRDSTSSKSSFVDSSDGTDSCPGNSSDHHGRQLLENARDRKLSVKDEKLNDSIKVVGEKAIVFSQWTRMLDLLEDRLKNSSIQYRRLDGTMSVVARDKAVKDFNTLPEVSVIIMSLKAASLGLNMVAACHVLLLDLWWNPTTEDQAIDRAHRIGQTRPVTVLRLTVKDTVEDRILALQQRKREMVASAFGEDETGGSQTRLTVEDLTYLFMV